MAEILIVDDDDRLGAMLRRSFATKGHRCSVVADGNLGLKAAIGATPDVVILDWMLPGIDGLEICRRIRALSDVPVVMLTARDALADRVNGLRSGADDYIIKPVAFEELLARIEAILRRQSRKTQELCFDDLTLDIGTRRAWRNGEPIDLTTTEFELLTLFMRHPRQVLTRKVIMDRVWGYDFDGESNVLEVYIGYLRRKVEANGGTRILHTVRGAGYVLRNE